jgi:hypothetical protein
MTPSEDLAALIPELRQALALPTLEMRLRPEWAAGARAQIRSALVSEIGADLSETEREALARLDLVPDPPGHSVSISHTPSLGGFVYLKQAGPRLGFDLEDIARVHTKVVSRVSTPEELSAAPSPAQLWVAKEAAFKALRGRPKVIAALHARAWRSVALRENLSLWSCEVGEDSAPNAACRGWTVELSGTALAIFLAPA